MGDEKPVKKLRSQINGVVYSWNRTMAGMDHMEEFYEYPNVAYSKPATETAGFPEAEGDYPDVGIPAVDVGDLHVVDK